MFKPGEKIKFVDSIKDRITPNTGYISKKTADKPEHVWIVFENLVRDERADTSDYLVPIFMIEKV